MYSSQYNRHNSADKTLLTDMVFYGKSFAFTKKMVPFLADSVLLGISQDKLEETEISQEMVWGHFIDQKLLFENSEFIKAKYLDERPSTAEISPDCPGMIAKWLGWKIVTKYEENNETIPFKTLMENTNSQQIFEQSKYKGRASDK
jgi:hypothetical protein